MSPMVLLIVSSLISGLCFGVWPLLMNRSGLPGFVSAAVYTIFSLVPVLPFAIYGARNGLPATGWWFGIGAALVGGCGLVVFNSAVSQLAKSEIGLMIVLMAVVQIAIGAVNTAVMRGRVTTSEVLGFGLAIAATVLLSGKVSF